MLPLSSLLFRIIYNHFTCIFVECESVVTQTANYRNTAGTNTNASQMSLNAKISIHKLVHIPTVTYGHEICITNITVRSSSCHELLFRVWFGHLERKWVELLPHMCWKGQVRRTKALSRPRNHLDGLYVQHHQTPSRKWFLQRQKFY